MSMYLITIEQEILPKDYKLKAIFFEVMTLFSGSLLMHVTQDPSGTPDPGEDEDEDAGVYKVKVEENIEKTCD